MDNFNLKQYLTEGRLKENDIDEDATQRIKDLEEAIRQLEATCDSIRSMEDQQYIRNAIENYKEQIERLQGGEEMRWSDRTNLE